MRTSTRLIALAALAALLGGCGGPPAASPASPVAFFGINASQVSLPAGQIRRLEEAMRALIAEVGTLRAVPAVAVERRLRGKRGRLRPCLDAPCQVRVGRELAAAMALAVQIEQNLMQQCDVFAALYDLRAPGADQRARARASCGGDELRDSVQRAVCRVLVEARSQGPAQDRPAQHRDCLAAAELLWLDQEVESFRRRALSGDPEELLRQERALAEQALALRTRYQALVRAFTGTPSWSVAAECHSARIYESFAENLRSAPQRLQVPRALRGRGEAATSSFRLEMQRSLEEKARPLHRRAVEIYRSCLRRADQLRVSGPPVEDARRRLSLLEPR